MKRLYIFISCMLALAACQDDVRVPEVDGPVSFTVSVDGFDGDAPTRANMDGTGFEEGEWVRMKLICPFSPDTMEGETLDGTHNSFWLLSYSNGSLKGLPSSAGCDINGDFHASAAPDLTSQMLSQQTPYVFTAQTWNEEVTFYTGSSLRLHYSYIFNADQNDADGTRYRRNDLLWGQQFMQTGTPHVHITFQHKMAALEITVNDSELSESLASTAVLTLEGMPDIDQMEVVVGDYYADKDASRTEYGYFQQASCSSDNNGKVIGVKVLDMASGKRAKTYAMTGNPSPAGGDSNSTAWGEIPNTGVYTAYHDTATGRYRLIVPPCVLSANPVFYLRDKNRRFKVELDRKTFEQGTKYSVTLKLTNPTVQP